MTAQTDPNSSFLTLETLKPVPPILMYISLSFHHIHLQQSLSP